MRRRCIQCSKRFTPAARFSYCCTPRCRRARAAGHPAKDPALAVEALGLDRPVHFTPHDVPVAVVAHRKRREVAQELAESIGAEAVIFNIGNRAHTHVAALRWLFSSGAPWSVVIEDDVDVVPNFGVQLRQMLGAAPSLMVSLYRSSDQSVPDDDDDCWILDNTLPHAKGYAVATELVPYLITGMPPNSRRTAAKQIERFNTQRRQPIAYSWPSLLDHRADLPSLGDSAHHSAARVGTRSLWYPLQEEISA